MILVLSGSGSEAREFSAVLDKEEIGYLCMLPTLKEAAAYGSGNLMVGKFDSVQMEELFRSEGISGVADVDAGGNDMSRVTMAACENAGIPYVKYLPLPDVGRDLVTGMAGSYREIAEGINCLSGAAILYTTPAAASAIAALVENPEKLYTPVLQNGSFDVENALEYGLPLLNVIAVDCVDGVDAVSQLILRLDAKLLICDGSRGISDQIAAADSANIPLVLAHKTGIDYTRTAWSMDALLRVLRGWKNEKLEDTDENH